MMTQHLRLPDGTEVTPPQDQAEIIELCAQGARWIDVEVIDVEPASTEVDEDEEDSEPTGNSADGEVDAIAAQKKADAIAKRKATIAAKKAAEAAKE